MLCKVPHQCFNLIINDIQVPLTDEVSEAVFTVESVFLFSKKLDIVLDTNQTCVKAEATAAAAATTPSETVLAPEDGTPQVEP